MVQPIAELPILLDACCVLNLCATGQLLPTLKIIPVQVAVAQVVRERELNSLQSIDRQENQGASQFQQTIEQGYLKIVDFQSEEEAQTFVNYVFELGDDGESATGAIALHRQWIMATDDRRAISFFRREAPRLQILSTLDLMKYWSQAANLDGQSLREALRAIRIQGRYTPPKSHPLYSWWEKAIA